ncbi:MAG: hypothetical protein ACR2QW_00070 [bacterium]
MNKQTLRLENLAYSGTKGISQNNSKSGFRPAFLNSKSGRVEISRMESGCPAPVHLIDWLPREWASTIGKDGSVKSLIPEIISGFSRNGTFYTREETASF